VWPQRASPRMVRQGSDRTRPARPIRAAGACRDHWMPLFAPLSDVRGHGRPCSALPIDTVHRIVRMLSPRDSMRLLTVPGIFDSGPTHWQTLWEQEPERRCRRFEPASFDEPDAWDWVAAVELGVAELGRDCDGDHDVRPRSPRPRDGRSSAVITPRHRPEPHGPPTIDPERPPHGQMASLNAARWRSRTGIRSRAPETAQRCSAGGVPRRCWT
jgi:hypothetical protein